MAKQLLTPHCTHEFSLKNYSCELFNLTGTVGKVELISTFKLQLYHAIYRLRFYSNSLFHILLLSNSHNDVTSIQKNRDDKSQRSSSSAKKIIVGVMID